MNTSFTLDGGSSSAFVYSWDSQCYSQDPDGCYNTSVYNNQSLTYGAHTLNITMLLYTGPNTFEGITASDFWFDYAVISTPTSVSVVPSSTGQPMPSSQQPQYDALPPCGDQLLTLYSNRFPAAIGGAAGGIVIVVLAVFYFQRKGHRHKRHPIEVDPEPIEASFQPHTSSTFNTNPYLHGDTSRDWSPTTLLPGDTNLQTSDISPSPIPLPPQSGIPSTTPHFPASSAAVTSATRYTLSSEPPQSAEVKAITHTAFDANRVTPIGTTSAHLTEEQSLSRDVDLPIKDIVLPGIAWHTFPSEYDVPRSSVAATRTSQYSSLNVPRQPAEAETILRASAVTPTATGSPMNARLTEEQSELVQGLLRHNVPLPTVVGAIEGMLSREGPSGGGEGSGSRITQRDECPEADNPPDYEFV